MLTDVKNLDESPAAAQLLLKDGDLAQSCEFSPNEDRNAGHDSAIEAWLGFWGS